MPCRTTPLVTALLAVVLFVGSSALAEEPAVSFERQDGRMEIRVGDRPFAIYVWEDDKIPRPYFSQVHAPNGMRVTRRHPPDPELNKGNADHPTYHPGIWLAFGDIDGVDFWRNKARVRHVEFVEEPSGGEGRGTFTVLNSYETTGEEPVVVCMEICRYTLQIEEDGYYLTQESLFTHPARSFAFGDQEEMGLGVRIATDLTVDHGDGYILNSEGGENEAGTWGKRAQWCGIGGVRDGVNLGIQIVPGPENFRPSWFHARDYGLLLANPFGKKAMTAPGDDDVPPDRTSVGAGVTMKLEFGLWIYSVPEGEQPEFDSKYDALIGLLEP